jgi:hypothetical protein
MSVEIDNHCQIITEHYVLLQADISEGSIYKKNVSYGECKSN